MKGVRGQKKKKKKEKGSKKRKLIQRTSIFIAKKDYVVVVVQNNFSLENDLVLVFGEQPQQHSKQWVMGSECSYHMCSHKSWFVTYEEKSSGNVLMGNNAPCKSVGIGSAQIRVHNGIVRTLIEVLHVLELKKNLVSMGAMDSKYFSCWVEGGVMKIKRKREVCGNSRNQARKFVHPSRVHYERLCLCYFTIQKS